jgi:hypothetical protein
MLQNRSLPHVEYFTWIFAGHFFAFSPSSAGADRCEAQLHRQAAPCATAQAAMIS